MASIFSPRSPSSKSSVTVQSLNVWPGRRVHVLEGCPVKDMTSTLLVHVVDVLLSVMLGNTFVDLFEDRVRVLGGSVPVRVVEILPVSEAHLLSACHTLESDSMVR